MIFLGYFTGGFMGIGLAVLGAVVSTEIHAFLNPKPLAVLSDRIAKAEVDPGETIRFLNQVLPVEPQDVEKKFDERLLMGSAERRRVGMSLLTLLNHLPQTRVQENALKGAFTRLAEAVVNRSTRETEYQGPLQDIAFRLGFHFDAGGPDQAGPLNLLADVGRILAVLQRELAKRGHLKVILHEARFAEAMALGRKARRESDHMARALEAGRMAEPLAYALDLSASEIVQLKRGTIPRVLAAYRDFLSSAVRRGGDAPLQLRVLSKDGGISSGELAALVRREIQGAILGLGERLETVTFEGQDRMEGLVDPRSGQYDPSALLSKYKLQKGRLAVFFSEADRWPENAGIVRIFISERIAESLRKLVLLSIQA